MTTLLSQYPSEVTSFSSADKSVHRLVGKTSEQNLVYFDPYLRNIVVFESVIGEISPKRTASRDEIISEGLDTYVRSKEWVELTDFGTHYDRVIGVDDFPTNHAFSRGYGSDLFDDTTEEWLIGVDEFGIAHYCTNENWFTNEYFSTPDGLVETVSPLHSLEIPGSPELDDDTEPIGKYIFEYEYRSGGKWREFTQRGMKSLNAFLESIDAFGNRYTDFNSK